MRIQRQPGRWSKREQEGEVVLQVKGESEELYRKLIMLLALTSLLEVRNLCGIEHILGH